MVWRKVAFGVAESTGLRREKKWLDVKREIILNFVFQILSNLPNQMSIIYLTNLPFGAVGYVTLCTGISIKRMFLIIY